MNSPVKQARLIHDNKQHEIIDGNGQQQIFDIVVSNVIFVTRMTVSMVSTKRTQKLQEIEKNGLVNVILFSLAQI